MKAISKQIESILTKAQLEQDYKEFGSLSKIAKKYGLSPVPIRARFIEYSIPFKSKIHINECNHNIFQEETEKSFYLAGFIAADGCIRISKTNKNKSYLNHRLVIALSIKDESFLVFLRDLLGSNNKFNYYTHKLSKHSDKWKDSKSVKLSITSKQMVEDLRKFNIGPRKSLIYTFPEWIINHPLRNHFMRGYSDGDGSFFLNKELSYDRLCFSLRGTKSFLEVYKAVIETDANFESEASVRESGKIAQLAYKGDFSIRVRDFLFQNATIYLPRKYLITQEFNV